ncbi:MULTISPECIES: hypothetical protein [unclassified Corynebacterium]|uniref:hypothetical protein n=1 Tax=unclassified Corynebacterium TaxID=2624378 RepID=UPI0029CA1737|nr:MULTISPECIES: hypothetical protein [unclassified Corynebacterium]WPF66867.1 hypothetical protein OLX12_03850 [Corynebacterium sp. 22KM0430]WPF69355.1 hypothetical protein OLW90_03845 [Corynebacterium sp. 21KM1197]
MPRETHIRRPHLAALLCAGIFSTAALAACTTESDQPLLDAAQEAVRERDTDSVILTLTAVYGDRWEEYAALCPEAPRDLVAQALGIEEGDVPELQQDENALLRIKGSEVKAEVHPTETLLLCSGSNAPAYRLSEETVSVRDNRDLSSPNSDWWLTATGTDPLASPQ